MFLKEISSHKQQVKLWVDLDGVLVNFDKGVKKLAGKLPSELAKKDMWKAVYSIPEFFENLDWEDDGKQLWNAIKRFHPTILTGLPTSRNGEQQKRTWCARELGTDVPVIVCPSKDKHLYAKAGYILIDDRNDNVEAWVRSGGTGILHRSTVATLNELESYINVV